MKKRLILFITLYLMALPPAGMASSVDLGPVWLSLPASCDVFTRNMAADDPILALYGLSAGQVAQELSSRELLLRAREISGAYTITLSAQGSQGPDFISLSDDELLSLRLPDTAAPDASPVLRSRQAAFLTFSSYGSISLITRVSGTLYRLTLNAEGRVSGGMAESLRQTALSMDFGLGQ